MESIEEYRERKAGKVTPLSLATNVMGAVERGDVKKLISIAIYNDGELYVGWSGKINNFELLGILEGAKDEIKLMLEEDD